MPLTIIRAVKILSKTCTLAEFWRLRADRSNLCLNPNRYREESRERFLPGTNSNGTVLSWCEH